MEPGKASGQADGPATGRIESQLLKGVLEYCVLALMRDEPKYGVQLLRELEATGALATGQGTVYPLLSRLRREELVVTTWQESTSGPPRRYYALSEAGHAALARFAAVWPGFRHAVDDLVMPGQEPGAHSEGHHLEDR
ncbi:PadR family transcriptional regulator [Streptomyces sp. NPDC048428]|uniref:PadR family transcriptional regulator n=1 Tax=Streptomyces sp. NPDC048428 TaxID=3154503 RepID=UPI003415B877